MSEHPHIAVMRRAVAAFAAADAAALEAVLAPDVVWRVPGRSSIAGEYRGVGAVLGFFAELMRRSDGSFRVEPIEMFANDSGGVFLDRVTAARDGRKLDVELLLRVRIDGGRITCGTDHFHQEHAWDAFWG